MWAITLINKQNNTSLDENITKVCEMLCDYQAITNSYRVQCCLAWINDDFQVFFVTLTNPTTKTCQYLFATIHMQPKHDIAQCFCIK